MKSASLKNLAGIFLKLAEDYRQLLKQRIEKDPTVSFQEQILIRNDLVPIRVPVLNKQTGKYDETSFLGTGKFSEAYLVDYNGRQAVAKITGTESDVKMAQHLQQIKPEMGKLGKHIMDVFATITDPETGLIICVVEKLNPISAAVKEALWDIEKSSDESTAKSSDRDIGSKPRNVGSLVAPGVLNRLLDLAFRDFSQEVKLKSLPTLRKWLENVNFSKANTLEHMKKFIWNLSPTGEKIIADALMSTYPEESEEALSSEAHEIWQSVEAVLNMHFKGGNMPVFTEQTDEIEFVSNLPEVKSLMQALKLMQKSGITWADMHSGNIMERPGTHDLVICDPGWFKIETTV